MRIFFPFPVPLVTGVFRARPQRFLIDTTLEDGSAMTAYCANPGSFESCFKSGCPVLLWESPDKKRKRRHTWRASKPGRVWIGTDTHLANVLVEKALLEHRIPTLRGFTIAKREPQGKRGGRLDFLLLKRRQQCFVEVKSATVAVASIAQFPDSRSVRACAHLTELIAMATAGHRAVIIFLVQRNDIRALRINRAFDPTFTQVYDRARESGVEVIAMKHAVSKRGFGPPSVIPVLDV